MPLDHFGSVFLETGALRTKHIRPTIVGAHVRVRGGVRAAEAAGVRLVIDVWTEDEDGVRLTDGEASIAIGPAAV